MPFNNRRQRVAVHCIQLILVVFFVQVAKNTATTTPPNTSLHTKAPIAATAAALTPTNATATPTSATAPYPDNNNNNNVEHSKYNNSNNTNNAQFEEVASASKYNNTKSNNSNQLSATPGISTAAMSPPGKQLVKWRRRRQAGEPLRIFGIRVDYTDQELHYTDNRIPKLMVGTKLNLRIFGTGIESQTVLALTRAAGTYNKACLKSVSALFKPSEATPLTALYNIVLPPEKGIYYICAKNDDKMADGNVDEVKPLIHMGSESYLQLDTFDRILPLWFLLILIIVLMFLSAMFSGLNLGLMALDRNELKIICNTGTEKERQYARTIWPVRNRGNFLLCSILLGNVLVNSTLTIMLESVSTGVIAVVCSTIIIVIFGEIIPQAACSRHGLLVGAKTIYLTKTVMVITSPVSYPISKILDCVLGDEIGNVYNRERLRELILMANEDGKEAFDQTEVNIISGALEMRKKKVGDIMTPLEDAYLLSIEAVLDFETISDIMKAGYSRIPVYDGERTNIVSLMYIKDLAFVDADDKMPLRALCEFYQNKVLFVDEKEHLNVMFDKFRSGQHGHLAVVQQTEPEVVTVGLVTLEDVIEELIQEEIVDETDVLFDNRSKMVRPAPKYRDFTFFASSKRNKGLMSSQMAMAAYQFMSASVPQFRSDLISETVLKRLLEYDIVFHIKVKGLDKMDPKRFIYEEGKQAEYFVMIIEGRVEVEFGSEKLHFESGPFSFYGTQVLDSVLQTENDPEAEKRRTPFVPTYLVRALTDVLYIAINRSLYKTARKATNFTGMRRSSMIADEEISMFFGSDAVISTNHAKYAK